MKTYNLTENQSCDLKFLEHYQATVSGNKVSFNKELSAADITDIEAHFNEMTQSQRKTAIIESVRLQAITDKATSLIEGKYPPLKQRKLSSVAISLIDKQQMQGITLTAAEVATLQSVRDVDAWITSIRDVENTAQANGTQPDDIVWPT